MMKKYSNEFKVGIMIILALTGLGLLTFKAGDFHFKKQGYRVYVMFDNIMGLENSAPVRLRGLEVGRVEDISVNYTNDKTEIVLTLWIDDKYKIRGTPEVYIRTLGLMGEKYVQIIDQSQSREFVKAETVLQGRNPADFEELIDSADEIAQNANNLILEVTALTKDIRLTLDENNDSIARTIAHLEGTSRNFEEFSEDIKQHPWKLLFRTKERKKRKNGK
jgi:phospholipid/cholesterol/gamma-HCH transport system substrate-binding protein